MKKKFFITLFIIVLVGFLAFAYTIFKENSSSYEPQGNISAPIEIPQTGIVPYQEIIDDEKPIVVMFYVDWCGYCRAFMPIFGNYAKKLGDKFTFAVVNCDFLENKKIVDEASISAFPTLKIIDKKYNVMIPMDIAATQDSKVFEKNLDNYLTLRKLIKD